MQQQATVILTEHDLKTMEDMFDAGSIAYVISTNNLYIKSMAGWITVSVSLLVFTNHTCDTCDTSDANNSITNLCHLISF